MNGHLDGSCLPLQRWQSDLPLNLRTAWTGACTSVVVGLMGIDAPFTADCIFVVCCNPCKNRGSPEISEVEKGEVALHRAWGLCWEYSI